MIFCYFCILKLHSVCGQTAGKSCCLVEFICLPSVKGAVQKSIPLSAVENIYAYLHAEFYYVCNRVYTSSV